MSFIFTYSIMKFRKIPSIPRGIIQLFFVFFFPIKEWWILSNDFSVSITMCVCFPFINMVYDIDWFLYVKPYLELCGKFHLVMLYNHFDMLD